MEPSEEFFIEALKNGDEKAYSQLVDDFQQRVYNTCLGFLKNPEEADDMTQEVFIEIFRSIRQFRNDAKLSTWIYRIAVNKSLGLLRAKTRKKRFAKLKSLFYPDQSTLEIPDFHHPGVIAENKERSDA